MFKHSYLEKNNDDLYKEKYIKYKQKYIKLRNQLGSALKSDTLTIPSHLNGSNYDDYGDWELYEDLNILFDINNLFSDYPKYNKLSSGTPVLVYKTEAGVKDIANIPTGKIFEQIKEKSTNFNELFNNLIKIINEELSSNPIHSSKNIKNQLDLKRIRAEGFENFVEKYIMEEGKDGGIFQNYPKNEDGHPLVMNKGGKLKTIYVLSVEKNLIDKNVSTPDEVNLQISKVNRYLEANNLTSELTLAKFNEIRKQKNQESANRLAKEEKARLRMEIKERAKLDEEERLVLEKRDREERLRIEEEEAQRSETLFQNDLKDVEELKMQYKIAGEREISRVNAECNKIKTRRDCKDECFYLNKSKKCLITNKARDKILSDNKRELGNIQIVKDVEREQAIREKSKLYNKCKQFNSNKTECDKNKGSCWYDNKSGNCMIHARHLSRLNSKIDQ